MSAIPIFLGLDCRGTVFLGSIVCGPNCLWAQLSVGSIVCGLNCRVVLWVVYGYYYYSYEFLLFFVLLGSVCSGEGVCV